MIPDSTIAFSTRRALLEEALGLLLGAEAHHPLDAGAVVPAAIEDHDLARRREVPDVALDVHLRLLALGRRGERHHAEDPWADALGDPLDRAALAGRVPTLEDDADLGAGRLDPLPAARRARRAASPSRARTPDASSFTDLADSVASLGMLLVLRHRGPPSFIRTLGRGARAGFTARDGSKRGVGTGARRRRIHFHPSTTIGNNKASPSHLEPLAACERRRHQGGLQAAAAPCARYDERNRDHAPGPESPARIGAVSRGPGSRRLVSALRTVAESHHREGHRHRGAGVIGARRRSGPATNGHERGDEQDETRRRPTA